MKKMISLLLAAAMLLSLCACGSTSEKTASKPLDEYSEEELLAELERRMDANEGAVAETEPAEKIYQIGDTITTKDGMLEFTLDSFSFGDYRDGYTNGPSDDPDESTAAEEGKTFLFYAGTMTLVGDSKEVLTYYIQNYDIEVDYNNGYKFAADIGSIDILEPGTTNRNLDFEPLIGSKTRDVKGYVEVPEIVETDTESPLLLKLEIGRIKYDPMTEVTIQLR